MSNEDSSSEECEMDSYLRQATSMMHIFKPEEEFTFYAWLNKFEFVASIIKVPDDKMIEFFFKMVDNEIHEGVKTMYPSVNFFKISYQETIQLYFYYFSSQYGAELNRKRFLCRKQYEQETIEKYAKNLLQIYEKCCFTNNNSGRKLLAQLIIGLRNDELRTHLKQFPDMSFNSAVTEVIKFREKNINSGDNKIV